jgi:hypothetical protein
MKALKNFKLILLPLLILFFNCNNDSSSTSESGLDGPAKISIRLVDEPGDFQHVFIDVVDVMIKYNDDSDDDNGWESIGANQDIYDLLELTGGIDALLVEDYEMEPGTLNQIRLILGENNSVVMEGETEAIPLRTPSAQQSGLKLKVNHELEAGFTYKFLLDFDVDKSVVIAGNSGNINLKPVIRVTTEFASGKIQGSVNPFDMQVMASVMVDGEIISAYADESGVFVLNGVPAGTYDVTVIPDPESGYAETVAEDVVVVNGEVTVIEPTIELELIPGSIAGNITNVALMLTASVMVDGETVSVDIDTSVTGAFVLENIPPGSYTVTLTPAEGSGLAVKEELDVVVEPNTETNLGDLTLVE